MYLFILKAKWYFQDMKQQFPDPVFHWKVATFKICNCIFRYLPPYHHYSCLFLSLSILEFISWLPIMEDQNLTLLSSHLQ